MKVDDFQKLFKHVSAKPRVNMHTRKSKIVSYETTLKYVNIMKVESSSILGHVAGSDFDFEYELLEEAGDGVFRILRNTGSLADVLTLLEKEKVLMLKRVETDDGKSHPVQYKEGEYYVKRAKEGRVTPALTQALEKRVFSKRFAENLVSWNFILVKGQPKRTKT